MKISEDLQSYVKLVEYCNHLINVDWELKDRLNYALYQYIDNAIKEFDLEVSFGKGKLYYLSLTNLLNEEMQQDFRYSRARFTK